MEINIYALRPRPGVPFILVLRLYSGMPFDLDLVLILVYPLSLSSAWCTIQPRPGVDSSASPIKFLASGICSDPSHSSRNLRIWPAAQILMGYGARVRSLAVHP